MEMKIEDIIQGLKETYMICCSVFAYDRKKYIDGAIDRLNKYQMMQADYEARLKADMVAILTDIQLEIGEKEQYYQDKFLESENDVHDLLMGGRMYGCGECKELIQQKIDKLKGVEE